MAITNVAATGTETTAGSRTRLAENFDTFLTLLTTQLKNQDPLSPMDSTQFTQQMVQMTGVEQQLMTNDLLGKLVANSNSGISTAVSMIGKEVRAVTDTAAIQGGKANWIYDLDSQAESVKVEIVDSTGKTVHTKTLSGDDLKAGEHAYSWDGKDLSGKALPNGGAYTLKVTALDSSAATVPTSIFVKGIVSGVEQVDGQTLLSVNGSKVAWDKVASIALPEEAANDDGATPDPTKTASGDDTEANDINPTS